MRRTAGREGPAGRTARIISAHAENSGHGRSPRAAFWDHLRACGEQNVRFQSYEEGRGSSPRMRRTVRHDPLAHLVGGIISAHAENSGARPMHPEWARDHLRACGEQVEIEAVGGALAGSSPRMRRTARLEPHLRTVHRIISAHAENSVIAARNSAAVGDHLRACGEQYGMLFLKSCFEGSSPRMRRTVISDREIDRRVGIISAHAENSCFIRDPSATRQDHLRACGEQLLHRQRHDPIEGSSPRMRRTDRHMNGLPALAGIISAHAENRPLPAPLFAKRSDHLRACGEQGASISAAVVVFGSSPRMRRTVDRPRSGAERAGIISAHAENSRSGSVAYRCKRDHLRACGEQPQCGILQVGQRGSSPRMRRTGVQGANHGCR